MATKRLDINTASREELAELPMVGEERAEVLVQQRPFHDWNEIDELPGFNSRLIEDIQKEGAYLGAQSKKMGEYAWDEEEEDEEQW